MDTGAEVPSVLRIASNGMSATCLSGTPRALPLLENMEEILFLFLGAIVGIVLEVLFEHRIRRVFLTARRKVAQLTRRPDPIAGKPAQLRFGNIITDWVSLYGTGELPLQLRYLNAELTEEFIALPKELEALVEEVRKELQEKAEQRQANVWNAKRFALVDYYPTRYGPREEIGLHFQFKLTDYASFLALSLKLDEPNQLTDRAGQPASIREIYFPQFDPKMPNPYVTHSFGINLAVVSSDSKLLVTHRNALVAVNRQTYSIPVNEGMQYPQDLDKKGKPSFLRTAHRGIYEELGIDIGGFDPVPEVEFFNFGALALANQYALLGRIKLPLRAAEIVQAFHECAKDRGMETQNELHVVDYFPDAIVDFIEAHRPWTHNGLATIYFTMVAAWGYNHMKDLLGRRRLNWDTVRH